MIGEIEQLRRLWIDLDGLAIRRVDPVDDIAGHIARILRLDSRGLYGRDLEQLACKKLAIGLGKHLAGTRHGTEAANPVPIRPS